MDTWQREKKNHKLQTAIGKRENILGNNDENFLLNAFTKVVKMKETKNNSDS